ncbi:MAG: ABC transporter permease [Acidimicrobiales bacterium]
MRALAAQTRTELSLTLRNGEQLLLTLGIPVLVLVFFSTVDVLPLPDGTEDAIDFLAPGVLTLALLSTAFTGLAIGTGFDRQYGVLKRLGATPLGRPRLLAAKTASVLVTLVLQYSVLVPLAVVLGWRPEVDVPVVVGAVALATIAFCGLALLMAGTLPGLVTLAAANGVYVVLLLFGDIVIPIEELPAPVAAVTGLLPTAALSELMRAGTGPDATNTAAWAVLVGWAIAAPAAASRLFRWE